MQSHMFFRGCPQDLKAPAREYWERKTPRLRRLLARFHAATKSSTNFRFASLEA